MPVLPARGRLSSFAPEVLKPAGPERALPSVTNDCDFPAPGRDLADARRGHAADLPRQPRNVARAGGEEQLEIFAAVEGERNRVGLTHFGGFQQRVNGQERGVNARADAALAAQVREV